MEPSYRFERVFRDFDLLAETARAWDLDFRQVGRGAFEGRLLQVGGPGLRLGYAQFNRALDQRGSPPQGMRTFVVPAHARVTFHWRGRTIRGNDILVFPLGGELQGLSGPGFAVHTVSIDCARLDEAAAALGLPDVEGLIGRTEVFSAPAAAVNRVRRAVTAAYDLWTPEAVPRIARRILLAIRGPRRPARFPARACVLDRARADVDPDRCGELSVTEWAARLGVHERTLQRAFRGIDGVSPKSYLLGLRLNEVRRKLRAPGEIAVGEVARQCGFWHMGQFAADYRRYFGELPSETVRRLAR